MKIIVQRFFVAYGCLALWASVVWFVHNWSAPPETAITHRDLFFWVFVVNGAVLCVTFMPRTGLKPFWTAVWRVSAPRVRRARRAVGGSFLLCVAALLFVVVASRVLHDQHLTLRALVVLLASMAILNSVYIVVHWGFRPENLFSERFRRFVAYPITSLLAPRARR